MREPFTRHAELLQGVRAWHRAEAAYQAAKVARRDAIRGARNAGCSVDQVASAYGISERAVQKIVHEATR